MATRSSARAKVRGVSDCMTLPELVSAFNSARDTWESALTKAEAAVAVARSKLSPEEAKTLDDHIKSARDDPPFCLAAFGLHELSVEAVEALSPGARAECMTFLTPFVTRVIPMTENMREFMRAMTAILEGKARPET
jgi:hypothetical protein